MFWVSFFTMPLGLTEPLFVPEYWNPPSLFNLAQLTGFDIESLIFCFAIGGLGAVFYNALFKKRFQPVEPKEILHPRHRFHLLALFSPVFIFWGLYFFTSLNPIYPGIIAMFFGAIATLFCRPDLKWKIWIGGIFFLVLYFVYFLTLILIYPSYVDQVWNLDEISGIMIFKVPLEELLFGFTFGMLWSSVYEHIMWKKSARIPKE